jgi:hypothetical protein
VPSRRAPVAHTDTRVSRQSRDPLRATSFRHWTMAKKRMHQLGTLLAHHFWDAVGRSFMTYRVL